MLGTGVRGDDSVEVYHDRIRETVAVALEPLVRTSMHAGLANAFIGSAEPDVEAIATHLYGAGETTRAARYALRAARSAERVLAFDRAASLYAKALSALASSPWRSRRVLVRLGDALAHAGRGPEAADKYLSAAAQYEEPQAQLELRRRAAEQLLASGHADRGERMFREVLEPLGQSFPDTKAQAITPLLCQRARARVALWRHVGSPPPSSMLNAVQEVAMRVCGSVGKAMTTTDPIRSADFMARHLRWALRSGDSAELARGLAMEAIPTATNGQPARARVSRLFELAEDHAARAGDAESAATVAAAKTMATYLMGDWAAGLELSRQTIEQCGSHPELAWERNNATMFGVLCLTWIGDLGRLGPWVKGSIETAEARGDVQVLQNLSAPTLPFVRIAEGRPEVALEELDTWEAWLPEARFTVQNFNVAHSRLYIRQFLDKDPEQTFAMSQALVRDLKRAFMNRVQQLRLVMGAAEGVCAMGLGAASQGSRRDEMIRFLGKRSKALDAETGTWGQPTAALLRAGRSALRGTDEETLKHLEEAEEGYAHYGMNMHWGATRQARARLLGGTQEEEMNRGLERRMTELGFVDPLACARLLFPFRL